MNGSFRVTPMYSVLMMFAVSTVFPVWLTGCAEARTLVFEDVFQEESQIVLDSRDEFLIGPLPRIATVTAGGDIIILDITPRAGIYDRSGAGKGMIGGPGDGPGEYRNPVSIASHNGNLYLYDSMMSRISCYDGSYRFVSSIPVSELLDEIDYSEEGRLYGYWSTHPSELVCELDDQGQLLRRFAPQSENHNEAARSAGGGVVISGGFLYTISPYEYTLSKYSLDGVLVDSIQGRSAHYVPPPEQFDVRILNDIPRLDEYHDQWSHILQILRIGDRGLAVVFAAPGYSGAYLALYDSDLNPIAEDIQLPDYKMAPGALFSRGDRLYMLLEPSDDQANPSVAVYTLRRSLDDL
ncbi:MAG: 6-bladed beta-propeller [Gemmatimonadetes bacterium]|nr:6-bladed beta-propeller [Gemmatimonadota bacterium]MYG86455.1 6-bladed beta-propeller [Gemmatimonadota bacterium]MYJ89961.1 6-bladed beta-propeller [Gemmatimonadota bacterium]